MYSELAYQLSLTLIPNIGPVQAKILLQHHDVGEIFKAKKRDLERIEGIGTIRAESIKSFTAFGKAEAEIAFIEKYRSGRFLSPIRIIPGGYLTAMIRQPFCIIRVKPI